MIARNFIVATAGHVDHGKSSLVKALTGTDPDRLPEEKARGITIDLGFANLELMSAAGADHLIHRLGIVDVPGHEDFVKNMVAGVGSVDLALLIVAADDGWMPQTEEHLQILSYLGVRRAVVALSKIDLAVDAQSAEQEIRQRLQNSPFANAPIVATSTVTKRGLEELKHAIAIILDSTSPSQDFGKPRLSVDRVFVVRGIGTVVTGTTTGGTFHRGADVVVQPSGAHGRIRSVQNHNRDVDASGPGTRTALSIPEIKGATVKRGDVIAVPNLGEPSTQLDVLLERSPRLLNAKAPTARLLKDGTRVRIHIASSNIPAHLVLFGKKTLESGESCLAHLRLESAVYAFTGDRFILRDWAQQATLCGGVILDPDPPVDKVQSIARREFLEARANAIDDPATLILTLLRRSRAVPDHDLLLKSRFSADEIRNVVQQLAAERKVLVLGHWIVDLSYWDTLRAVATARIEEEHRQHPNRAGLGIQELKAHLEKQLISPELFNPLISDLPGCITAGAIIKRATHRLALPPSLQSAGDKVRAALSARSFDPPSRKEIAPEASTQRALTFLIETGEAIYLSEDVVLLTQAFERACHTVVEFLKMNRSATASELRQALNTSRRVIIPLLETLDAKGITRRDGDKRILA